MSFCGRHKAHNHSPVRAHTCGIMQTSITTGTCINPCIKAWAFLPSTPKMPSMRNGNDIDQDVKNISTANQHTAHIIRQDGLHSRGSCQKIITAARDASGNGAAWVHYKSQPSSLLSHPLLSPPSSGETGECEAPSSSLPSPNRVQSSAELSAAIGPVPCLPLLIMREGSGENVCHGRRVGL